MLCSKIENNINITLLTLKITKLTYTIDMFKETVTETICMDKDASYNKQTWNLPIFLNKKKTEQRN